MKTKKTGSVANTDVNNQGAINAMAHEVYVIKQAGKQKALELEKFEPTLDADEVPFLKGVPFEFPLETKEGTVTVTGKLKLRNQRNWDLIDVVVKGEKKVEK